MSDERFPAPWGEYRGRSDLTNPWEERPYEAPGGSSLTVLIYYVQVAYYGPKRCASVAINLVPLVFSDGVLVAKSWADLERLLQQETPPGDRVWGFLRKCK
jgi:hypothetical protein